MRRLAVADRGEHVGEPGAREHAARRARHRVLVDVAADDVVVPGRAAGARAISARASRPRLACESLSRWIEAARTRAAGRPVDALEERGVVAVAESAMSRNASDAERRRRTITAVPFGAHGISGTSQFDHQSRVVVRHRARRSRRRARRGRPGSSDSWTSCRQTTSVVAARLARNAAIRARRKAASSSAGSSSSGYQTRRGPDRREHVEGARRRAARRRRRGAGAAAAGQRQRAPATSSGEPASRRTRSSARTAR